MIRFNFSLVLIFMIMGCGTPGEEIEDDKNDTFNQELLGYWTLAEGTSFAINDKGVQITTATLKPNTFAHEFFANGTTIGYDLTGHLPKEEYKWELVVRQNDVKDIEEGTLSFWNETTKQQAGELFFDSDGRLNYSITSLHKFSLTGKSRIYLKTKKYEAYPYKENWVELVYEKK
ncbi:MAG: hypothetical protein IPL23_15940 [Saprospiraceae bacterium]|nr:hypothetical protein [Saprospiraceae bacterium]